MNLVSIWDSSDCGKAKTKWFDGVDEVLRKGDNEHFKQQKAMSEAIWGHDDSKNDFQG